MRVTEGRPRFFAAWGLALVLGAGMFATASYAFRSLPRPKPLEELSYYPSGRHLLPATLGHSETAADLAWFRAVQYYGEHRLSDNRFDHMKHVFDILTTLAPGFEAGYVFGAFAMAQEGHDFPGAEALLLKGIEANPRDGRLAFELGFLYFVRPGGRDLGRAAEYFEQASRQPGGPPQAAHFAAYARQNSGSMQFAYELWLDVYQNSPNRYLRETAAREMQKLRAAIAAGKKELAMQPLTTPRVAFKAER